MPVPGSRLRPPVPRRRLVARRRLTGTLLDPASRPRLVLVAAPAGFGKTTLLTQWLTAPQQAADASAVAWLSLDHTDADPHRFLGRLLAAVRAADPAVAAEASTLLDQDRPAESVLVSLVNDLDAVAGPTVVALDDYHLIDNDDVHDAVRFLLDNLPPQLTLAIATRMDPPLQLARLRARGELLELRAADLRFTVEEAAAFLNDVLGLALTPGQVAALDARTEGWAAGLQLAGLSVRAHLASAGQVDGFVRGFTGSHRFVLDYLLEEVLRQQPDELRAFLLDTAVLDELSGGLCDALTGRSDGGETLHALERGNLFVVPLDSERRWFRYHQLFAEALRAQLVARQPDRLAGLRLAAARWYAGRGEVVDALPYALAAGDAEYAADLLELALPELRRDRRDRALRHWLGSLPAETVRRRALLATFRVWASLADGDLAGVESWLRTAEAALGTPPALARADEAIEPLLAAAVRGRDRELRELPAMIEVYRATVAQARGDVAGTVAHAQRALGLAGPADHLARGAAAGFLGLAAFAAGDLGTAVDTFGEAVRHLHDAGNVADALGASLVLAQMWQVRGGLDEARTLLEGALDAAGRHPGPVLSTVGDLHVGLAEVLREQDDLESAEQHLDAARELGDAASLPEHRHRWHLVTAGVQRARGDLDGAAESLARAQALHLPGFLPDLRPVAATRARLAVAEGRLRPAWDWARRQRLSTASEGHPPAYLDEYGLLTLARLQLAAHRAEPARVDLAATSDLVDRVVAEARRSGRSGSLLEALIVRALAARAAGDAAAALADLGAALELAAETGHRRLFLDEGAPMLELLGDAAAACAPVAAALAGALLRGSEPSQPEAAPVRAATAALSLSARELEVLRLLASELTGPEIARRLFVSVNTLRSHTKHIFTKLDANTRRAAVRRAQEAGLL